MEITVSETGKFQRGYDGRNAVFSTIKWFFRSMENRGGKEGRFWRVKMENIWCDTLLYLVLYGIIKYIRTYTGTDILGKFSCGAVVFEHQLFSGNPMFNWFPCHFGKQCTE